MSSTAISCHGEHAIPIRFGQDAGRQPEDDTMMMNHRLSRSLGIPCIVFLLCAVMLVEKSQALTSDAFHTGPLGVQLNPVLVDGYKKLWSQVLTNTKVTTGPKLKNPAISGDGLTPAIVRALHEQRTYLKTHKTVALNRTPVNLATTESVGDNSRTSNILSPSPTCREPMVRSVNGKTKGVVFTPTAADNRYRIEGCLFGDAPGIAQLEVRSNPRQAKNIPPIALRLDSTSHEPWSDHQITVQLDAKLGGIQDHPVTLVVYPAKHPRIELRGCRFVAARSDPQLLSMIPSTWVSLYPSGLGSRSIRQLEYASPTRGDGPVPKDAAGSSALVVRSDPEQFGIGTDTYDFSHLNPGWVVESVQLQTYEISCPDDVTQELFGRWTTEWTLHGVRVSFRDSACAPRVSSSPAFGISFSQYAIRVWVVGPVGTQPLALAQ